MTKEREAFAMTRLLGNEKIEIATPAVAGSQ